ncbi:MAG: hypothetical protein JSR19_00130 [Proteobacteria bacterium]|nr:hypothetical protein [Pseudomonadota bacterium]HQR04938.1 hypothetical protein [Rhodocyclaceae bacterium]
MKISSRPPLLSLSAISAGWPLLLLCGLFLGLGLLDHDPWKADDATHIGIALEFAHGGDWLRPRLGGDPWFGAPPLYHWLAALSGKATAGFLSFAAGARLVTLCFAALLFWGLSLAARAHDETSGRGAPLLILGTLGLLTPIHDAQPWIGFLAAQSFFLLGLIRLPEHPMRGGIITGLALGLGAWTSGLAALVLLLPLIFLSMIGQRHRGTVLASLLMALILGLGFAALWPMLLHGHHPELVSRWWSAETMRLGLKCSGESILDHLELLGWAAWPILPLALWALWTLRQRWREPQIVVPLASALVALAFIVLCNDARPLNHLPLYPPLALLATAGVGRLKRGAANALDWFGMMTFTLTAGLIWLGSVSMMSGQPERVARNFLKAEPGFVGQLSIPALIAALTLTVLWLWTLVRLPKGPWRGVRHWAAGMAFTWGLLALLWMPWFDYGKSYRPVAISLQDALGGSHQCIAQSNLGDGQKASLRYFISLRLAPAGDRHCPWLLTQSSERGEAAPAGWKKVWEGHRPGDKGERLRLYRRSG